MAELFAAFAGALVKLVVAAIQLCIQLVALVLEALGFSVGTLAKQPQEGGARFSGKRLAVAFAPLALILITIVGTFGILHWRAKVRRERILATRTLVEEQVDRLAEQVDDLGRFKKHPAPTLKVNDAWGNPLQVAYEETLTHQVIAVRSADADGEMDTLDDIASTQRRLRPKHEIAMGVFEKAKIAVKNRVDNVEQP